MSRQTFSVILDSFDILQNQGTYLLWPLLSLLHLTWNVAAPWIDDWWKILPFILTTLPAWSLVMVGKVKPMLFHLNVREGFLITTSLGKIGSPFYIFFLLSDSKLWLTQFEHKMHNIHCAYKYKNSIKKSSLILLCLLI